jgi:hypothetical protein
VDQAIDKLIARVLGMFKGKGGKDGDKKDGDKADGDKPDGDEVPKSITASATNLDKLNPALSEDISKASTGTVIWQAPVTDPKVVTKNLLHDHSDASFNKTSGNLTLPATKAGPLESATSLSQLGSLVGQETGVSKVTLDKTATGFKLIGAINPSGVVASGGAEDPKKKAQDHFGKNKFSRQDLQDLLGCGATKATDLITAWVASGDLHEFKSKPRDPLTKYTFDKDSSGTRELPDTPSNRDKFGFINPKKTDSNGIAILSKGLRADSPPGDHGSADYHQTLAKYDSKRPGSSYKNFGFGVAILGHKEEGCSGYWNTEGFKHTRAENMKWCKDPNNYWGPEHEEESNASGGSAQRYKLPSKEEGLNAEWWPLLDEA